MTNRRRVWLIVAVLCCSSYPAAATGQAGGEGARGSSPAIQQIVTLLDHGDWEGAKRAVANALRRSPDDPALHNFAGVIDAQLDAYASAESHFKTAIRLAPRAVPPHENLGRLYQEHSAGDAEARAKALATYDRLLEIDPAHVEALYQAAFLRVLNGQFAAAHVLVARLPEPMRRRPQVLAVRAAATAGTGQPARAEQLAAELSSHPDLSAADVAPVLPAAGDTLAAQLLEGLDRRGLATPELLERLGALRLKQGRFADARAMLERAGGGRPNVPILLTLARAAYQMRDHTGALGYLAHARALEPQNATVHFLFGMVCVEQDLAGEAYEALKKAVALDPENPMINYAMGAVATHRHEPVEALPYFEKYVQLKPDDPRGRFALGAARFYSNQFDAAVIDLDKAARSAETATGAHYFLARIARQANDLDTARREIDAALTRAPAYADAWAELGLLQTRTGEYSAAEQSLQKALALDPRNYQATVNLATLYSRTRDPRREAQAAKVAALLEERAIRAQEFLRIIKVVP